VSLVEREPVGQKKLSVLSLFAGIGGFDYGLEKTGGFKTVALCEIAEYPRRVLAKHWPGVPIYEDVRELTAERLRADGISVDVITGGFPCQDISLAGRMAGLDGAKSGLWQEYHRLIGELAPQVVIIENSPVLRTRGLEAMLRQLASLGYDAEWHCIPANAIGAPHRRDRLWVIAYTPSFRDGVSEGQICTGRHLSEHSDWWACEPNVRRVDDGIPDRVRRLAALGSAVVPQITELIGRALLSHPDLSRGGEE
jgi:DNA (cytosine-5)-methyltransferase 1